MMVTWKTGLPRSITCLHSLLSTLFPGHFELATKSELQQFRNYLAALRDQVARMYREGLPLQQVQAALVLNAYKNFRQYPNYEATFKDNAAAYYRQLEKRSGPATLSVRAGCRGTADSKSKKAEVTFALPPSAQYLPS